MSASMFSQRLVQMGVRRREFITLMELIPEANQTTRSRNFEPLHIHKDHLATPGSGSYCNGQAHSAEVVMTFSCWQIPL